MARKPPPRCNWQHVNCRTVHVGSPPPAAGTAPSGAVSSLANGSGPSGSGNNSVTGAWDVWVEYDFPPATEEEKPSLGEKIVDNVDFAIARTSRAVREFLDPPRHREGSIESPSTYTSELNLQDPKKQWEAVRRRVEALQRSGALGAGPTRNPRADNIAALGGDARAATNRAPSTGYATIENRLNALRRAGII